MKIIIGNFYQSMPQGSTVSIHNAATDPVPTAALSIKDNTSSLTIPMLKEILILDDKKIPNTTVNLALNPTLNPYTDYWTTSSGTGQTTSQNGGGGIIWTFSNATINFQAQSYIHANVVANQTYAGSVTVIASSPVALVTGVRIAWYDASNNQISTNFHEISAPTSSTRISVSGTAPSNAVAVTFVLYAYASNSTNSGSVTFTNAQFEPQWFSNIAYPTPFCGPNQTNCQQISFGPWIRQYRKFAGFVVSATYGDYIGDVRTVQVKAVGYAWLASTILSNKTYTSQFDSAIIADLINTYLTSTSLLGYYGNKALFTTTNVVQGTQLSSFQLNWDDLRTAFNNLVAQSTFYWTVDYYWSFVYTPLGYITMPISLICDNSSTPDMVTTFPAYNFSAEVDYTQPGTNILVLGNGSNTAQVIDPVQTASLLLSDWFYLPPLTAFARKINESSLNSANDVVQRGIAELLQYDQPRNLYHLTTNVELIAGEAIAVTSNTDNLKKTVLLIQTVDSTWLGTDETLTDVWEYRVDLGAINRQATNILSRLARLSNANTSAPSITTTALAAFERVGITDTVASTSTNTSYQAIILGDSPIAYYRLDEIIGTIADDFSGNAYAGTLHGGVTLGATGLLYSGSDTAMTFNGSTGYISLPTTLIPTGSNHAWSLECWCNVAGFPSSPNFSCMVAMGTAGTRQKASLLIHNNSGTVNFVLSCFSADITSSIVVSTGTIYYVVGTYDGTDTRLYVNGSLVAGPTAFSVTLGTTFADIGADNSGAADFFNGTIDEPAIYNYMLSSVKIATHYANGTSLYASAILADLPLAYYRLGESSGTTAIDGSGNAKDGTYSGGFTLAQTGALFGDSNTAVLFNGTTGYMLAPVGLTMNGWTSMSFEVWLKLTSNSFGSTYPCVAGNDFPQTSKNGFSLILAPASDGKSGYFQLGFGGVSQVSLGFGTGQLATGQWYHIVCVYDGAHMLVYLDGAQVASTAATGTIGTAVDQLSIAQYPASSGVFVPGTFDEVAIYQNEALSASRVTTHYNIGTLGHA